MFTELFRIGHRSGLVAAVMLVSVSLASAATPVAHPLHTVVKTVKPPAHKRKPAKARPAPTPPELVLSESAGRVSQWVAAAQDNGSLPYIVIDKPTATLTLFKANGEAVGQTPVLLGMGVGDDSSPGVGAKTLAAIGPAERTTPAGRFVAKFGLAFGHEQVLWVDYADSVALHAVITTNKKERRVARLLSPTPDDNRISFGCINVGTGFYTKHVLPMFRRGGVVYILPDTKPLDEVFPRLRLLPYLSGRSEEIRAQRDDDPLQLKLGSAADADPSLPAPVL